MKKLHIMNPCAGKGILPDVSGPEDEVYVTKAPGDAVSFLENRLLTDKDEEYRIYAYGGDGTQNEIVTAVMNADAGGRVILSPVPTGSGNDFERMTSGIGVPTPCDIIKYNGKYAVNELNTGFDTGVVVRSNSLKRLPLVSGTASYILGVVGELIAKKPSSLRLTATYEDGQTEVFEGKYLLCVLANGAWYGGGFNAAPTAVINDGALELYLASDMSRRRFLGLVGKYRAGKHMDGGAVIPEAADILAYRRCVALRLESASRFSVDGEVTDGNKEVIEASVIPSAIRVMGAKF